VSGWALLAIVTLICAGGFANGMRFSRADDRLAARAAPSMDAARVRRFGLVFMIAAPLMWLFFAAMLFGLFGPVHGLPLVRFN
jgi:hypothetical protein